MSVLPASAPGRHRLLSAIAVLAFVAAGLYVWYGSTAPTGPALAPSNRAARAPMATAAAGGAAATLPDPVRLGGLQSSAQNREIGRNPFSFGEHPAPPAPPAPVRPAVPLPVAAPPPPAGPPPIPLKLVGMTVMPGSGRTMVTLREPASGALLQGFEGEVVDGRYRIVRIGLQSVVVSYVDGSGTRTIPLGG